MIEWLDSLKMSLGNWINLKGAIYNNNNKTHGISSQGVCCRTAEADSVFNRCCVESLSRPSESDQSSLQRSTAFLHWIRSCLINNEKRPQISSTPVPAVALWDARQITCVYFSLYTRCARNSPVRLLTLHDFCCSEFVAQYLFPVVVLESVQEFQVK